MKYSIIMPYLNRFQHLNNTLWSFEHWYRNRDDYEIIIVEDTKNQMDSVEHMNLLSLIDEFEDLCEIQHLEYSRETYNPAGMFNLAVDLAKGDRLILTNPECFHENDILGGLDKYNEDDYIVCACKSVYNQPTIQKFEDMKYDFEMWYVHSVHYDRKIHFCTCISHKNFCKIHGFDTAYLEGIAYEDDDFVKKVEAGGINIVHADELVVLHQAHSRQYGAPNHMELMKKNELIYKRKWGL